MSAKASAEAEKDPGIKGIGKEAPTGDAVSGEATEDGPNYRSLRGIGAIVIMVKSIIGLCVLAIPSVLDNLGLIPGAIALGFVGSVTWWSTRAIGLFKLNHPEVYAIDDAGAVLLGKIGREMFGAAFCIRSLMLGTSIGLNTVSEHRTFTAVFVAVAAVLTLLTASVWTLNRISWLARIGVISVIVAVLIVTISVGVQDRPATAPIHGPWESDYKLFNRASFREAMSSLSTLDFSYCGVSAYFSVASEMQDIGEHSKAAAITNAIVIGTLLTIGSAGPLMKKISYGLALPGVVITGTMVIHYESKIAFIRILRNSRHLTSNTIKHWTVWLGCTFVAASAGAIPIFSHLVSLIGALSGTLIDVIPMEWSWLYDNWRVGTSAPTWKWALEAGFAVVVILFGLVLLVGGGTYSVIADIVESYRENGGSSAWACEDNSNS